VALARALATEPEALLLDEPFSALDTQVKERLELELMTLQSYYRGNILIVTHNLAEGYKLASKIAVYESGHVVQCDDKSKVITSPASRTVARLTGVRNLLRGKITEIRDGKVTAQVPELGGAITVITKDSMKFKPDQAVTIGIRPEFIRVIDAPGENAYSCTADRIVESISLLDCYFHVNTEMSSGHWIEVSLPKLQARHFQESQQCYVYLPPEHVAIIAD
jgi:molybdate transport system ATP-binding protein